MGNRQASACWWTGRSLWHPKMHYQRALVALLMISMYVLGRDPVLVMPPVQESVVDATVPETTTATSLTGPDSGGDAKRKTLTELDAVEPEVPHTESIATRQAAATEEASEGGLNAMVKKASQAASNAAFAAAFKVSKPKPKANAQNTLQLKVQKDKGSEIKIHSAKRIKLNVKKGKRSKSKVRKLKVQKAKENKLKLQSDAGSKLEVQSDKEGKQQAQSDQGSHFLGDSYKGSKLKAQSKLKAPSKLKVRSNEQSLPKAQSDKGGELDIEMDNKE